MNKSMILISAGIIAGVAAPALAQSALDGTWKIDMTTAKLPAKPDVFVLKDGVYNCSTCVPAFTIPADGKPHAVSGHSYFDAMSVSADSPSSVSYVQMRAGKTVATSTDTVSDDGATLSSSFNSSDNAANTPISGTATATRVAPAPAGAHATSGSWRALSVGGLGDAALLVTMKTTDKTLMMKWGTGEVYNATFGGPYVPVVGDTGMTMAKVRRIDARTIEETDMRKGKVESRLVLTASADGKSVVGTSHSMRSGTDTTYTAYRQ